MTSSHGSGKGAPPDEPLAPADALLDAPRPLDAVPDQGAPPAPELAASLDPPAPVEPPSPKRNSPSTEQAVVEVKAVASHVLRHL
ncbi:MAG: hypothetical protein FJ095_07235 [Deltaproteobacteria bacterium]|nr:hypothetical protein [Deltaproteobacteria bacterium]